MPSAARAPRPTAARWVRIANRLLPSHHPAESPPGGGLLSWARSVDWGIFVAVVLIHVAAIAALFFITIPGLIAFLILTPVVGWIGVTTTYHRLLTHRSFETYRPIRYLLAIIGCWSMEGGPIGWVATHRKHHRYSDHDGDPHSPTHGSWWSHVNWLMPRMDRGAYRQLKASYAADLQRETGLAWVDRLYGLWNALLIAGLFGLGYWLGGWSTGVSMILWGVFMRSIYVLHSTWLVNSASHMFGYRNYETTDDSRNCWWVGLIAWGEGWHNNHHAYPRMAAHGHQWWEMDITYRFIWTLEKLGLAWNVVHESTHLKSGARPGEASKDGDEAGAAATAAKRGEPGHRAA